MNLSGLVSHLPVLCPDRYTSALTSAETTYSFDLRDALKPMGWLFLWNRVQTLLGSSLATGYSQDGGCSEEAREVGPIHNNPNSELLRVVAAGNVSSIAKYKQLRLTPVVFQTTLDFFDVQHGASLFAAKSSGCLGIAAIPVLHSRMRLALDALRSRRSSVARETSLRDLDSFWSTIVVPCLQNPTGAIPPAAGRGLLWPFPSFAKGGAVEIHAALLKQQDCVLLKQMQLVVVRTLHRVARVFADLQSAASGASNSTLPAVVCGVRARSESEGTPLHSVLREKTFFEESVAFSTIIEQALANCPGGTTAMNQDEPLAATLPVFAGFMDFGAHCSTWATRLALTRLVDHYETVERRYFESSRLQQSVWRFEAAQTTHQNGAVLALSSTPKQERDGSNFSRARAILAFWACQATTGIKSVTSTIEHELANQDTRCTSVPALLDELCLAATALQDCGDWDGQVELLTAVVQAAVGEWPGCAASRLFSFEVRAAFQKAMALQLIGEQVDPQPPGIYQIDALFAAPGATTTKVRNLSSFLLFFFFLLRMHAAVQSAHTCV